MGRLCGYRIKNRKYQKQTKLCPSRDLSKGQRAFTEPEKTTTSNPWAFRYAIRTSVAKMSLWLTKSTSHILLIGLLCRLFHRPCFSSARGYPILVTAYSPALHTFFQRLLLPLKGLTARKMSLSRAAAASSGHFAVWSISTRSKTTPISPNSPVR